MSYSVFQRTNGLAGRTILQIIPELDAGGAERTTIDVASALSQAGARPLVASEGGRLVSELQAKGGIWIPFPAKTKNPLKMALNVMRLQRVIEREGVDLIHARSRAPAWVAFGAVRGTSRPFVTTYHGSYSHQSSLKLLYNSVMARGDAVIANSFYTAEQIVALYPFAQDHVETIHRGTDLRQFAPSAVHPSRVNALRTQWGATPDQRIVLLAGRLTSWKGQKVLIDAADILVKSGLTNTLFILAGDHQGRSHYVEEIDKAIADKELTKYVRRVGHCTDMAAAYLAAAAVTVPSTQPEAFGRSAVEAQAMGVPVIVTNLGAVPETVLAPPLVTDAARTGWHIPPNDPSALARAIGAALGLSASARADLAQRSRNHVEMQFSLEIMCYRTLDIYARLLSPQALDEV
jgi:glycosyltransferase involved in cell wall biosynthesis